MNQTDLANYRIHRLQAAIDHACAGNKTAGYPVQNAVPPENTGIAELSRPKALSARTASARPACTGTSGLPDTSRFSPAAAAGAG